MAGKRTRRPKATSRPSPPHAPPWNAAPDPSTTFPRPICPNNGPVAIERRLAAFSSNWQRSWRMGCPLQRDHERPLPRLAPHSYHNILHKGSLLPDRGPNKPRHHNGAGSNGAPRNRSGRSPCQSPLTPNGLFGNPAYADAPAHHNQGSSNG